MSMTEHAAARSALRRELLQNNQTGARPGSRPKPPKAGARSASLEPGHAPGYPSTSQLLSRSKAREREILAAIDG